MIQFCVLHEVERTHHKPINCNSHLYFKFKFKKMEIPIFTVTVTSAVRLNVLVSNGCQHINVLCSSTPAILDIYPRNTELAWRLCRTYRASSYLSIGSDYHTQYNALSSSPQMHWKAKTNISQTGNIIIKLHSLCNVSNIVCTGSTYPYLMQN